MHEIPLLLPHQAGLLCASLRRSVANAIVGAYECGFSRFDYSHLRMDGKKLFSRNAEQRDNVYAGISADYF